MDNRPNKHARIFIELELIAQWATCQRGRVASALVNREGVILVPARNGTPYGIDTCKELGADLNIRCQFCIHSERNCLNHAARLGIRTQNQSIVTLTRPCINCANDIIQAGIISVFYRDEYISDDFQYVKSMFDIKNISFIRVPMTKQEKTFHNMIEQWRTTWI